MIQVRSTEKALPPSRSQRLGRVKTENRKPMSRYITCSHWTFLACRSGASWLLSYCSSPRGVGGVPRVVGSYSTLSQVDQAIRCVVSAHANGTPVGLVRHNRISET